MLLLASVIIIILIKIWGIFSPYNHKSKRFIYLILFKLTATLGDKCYYYFNIIGEDFEAESQSWYVLQLEVEM